MYLKIYQLTWKIIDNFKMLSIASVDFESKIKVHNKILKIFFFTIKLNNNNIYHFKTQIKQLILYFTLFNSLKSIKTRKNILNCFVIYFSWKQDVILNKVISVL